MKIIENRLIIKIYYKNTGFGTRCLEKINYRKRSFYALFRNFGAEKIFPSHRV